MFLLSSINVVIHETYVATFIESGGDTHDWLGLVFGIEILCETMRLCGTPHPFDLSCFDTCFLLSLSLMSRSDILANNEFKSEHSLISTRK